MSALESRSAAPLRTACCTSDTAPPISTIRKTAIVPVASSATDRVGEPRNSATARRAAGSFECREALRAALSRPRRIIGRQTTSPIAKPMSAATVVARCNADAVMDRAISTAPHPKTSVSERRSLRTKTSVGPAASGSAGAPARRIDVGGNVAGERDASRGAPDRDGWKRGGGKSGEQAPAKRDDDGLWIDDALATDRERGSDIARDSSIGDERDHISGEQAE